jgi:hypothetical protein
MFRGSFEHNKEPNVAVERLIVGPDAGYPGSGM